MVLFSKSNSLLNRQSMSIKSLTFVAMLMIMFMNGYNEGKAQTISECINSCTISQWSYAPEFVKTVNCSQNPNGGVPCTFKVKYKHRMNICNLIPNYEFSIENVSFSSSCTLGNCYDRSLLTEVTYWILVERYKQLEENGSKTIGPITNVTGVNAGCFIGSAGSPTFITLNIDNGTFTQSPVETGPSTELNIHTSTLTLQINPCLNTACCRINYLVDRVYPQHNGNIYDVYVMDPQPPITLDCQGNQHFTICHPACQYFANFDILPVRYFKEKSHEEEINSNDFIKVKTKNNKTQLEISNLYKGTLNILIYNLKSDLILSKQISKNEEYLIYDLKIDDLQSGFYNLVIHNEYGEVYNEKICIAN